jgi:hypothetical protein
VEEVEADTVPIMPAAQEWEAEQLEPNERLAPKLDELLSKFGTHTQLLATLAMILEQEYEDQDGASLVRGFAKKLWEHERDQP